jgi:Flp pilus assembly protein TadG
MSVIKRFLANTKANVSLIFGLSIIPITLIAGGAIDYAGRSGDTAMLQATADAAVLAGSLDGIPDAQRGDRVREYIKKNSDPEIVKNIEKIAFKYDSATGAGTLSIKAQLPASFMTIAGVKSWEVEIKASAIARPTVPRVLDVAMCIDVTGSMTPTINSVKNRALTFESDVNAELDRRKLPRFDSVRVRVYAYRDYGGNYRYNSSDGWLVDKYPNGWVQRPANVWTNLGDDVPMQTSAYFTLPKDASAFQSFVGSLAANGGGDYPESGLECVNEALNANWIKKGDVLAGSPLPVYAAYPMIIVWTDIDAQPPSHARSLSNPNYPPASIMPRDYAGLLAKWNNPSRLDQKNKRLITFMPSSSSTPNWNPLRSWSNYYSGGLLSAGNTNMVNKVVDAIQTLPPNRTPQLTQ